MSIKQVQHHAWHIIRALAMLASLITIAIEIKVFSLPLPPALPSLPPLPLAFS